MDLEQQLQMSVLDVAFRSQDGRYSVLHGLRDGDADIPITAIGDLGDAGPGEVLQLRGGFRNHPTYGNRFAVQSWTPITPSTASGIARYLGSGLVPGVGPALAARIVEHFGTHALDVISTQSARLQEVSGVGKRRAKAIAEAVRERKQEADLLSFMHGLGLGPAVSRRIRKCYGERTLDVLRSDPYLIASQVNGVGFKTADSIGLAQGYTHDDPRRAAGAVLHVVGQAADEGHTFVTRAEVIERCNALDVPEAQSLAATLALPNTDLLIADGDRLYAPPLFDAECRVARLLRRRAEHPVDRLDTDAVIAAVTDNGGQGFADLQLEAVRQSLRHRLIVLTGGPGTGKTTTVRAIVAGYRALRRSVALCSPTGRAAKRLTEATGCEAKTVHRLLEYNPAMGQFGRNQDCPIEADLVLVDEASMLDLQLADRLLVAVPASATLVLVGDVDQLPPISPGPTLRELLASGVGTVVRLQEVFRQAQKSAIVRSAHAIQHGQRPVTTGTEERGQGDLYFIRARTPDAILARVAEGLGRIRDGYNLDPIRDVQVLSPMRKGPLGTERLNLVLQDLLNPHAGGGGAYRPGDKVMQLRNDYDREVFNGDVGEVRRIESGVIFVDMGGRQVAYQRDAQEHLALAYASTIHKVQGSEFPAAVIVLHGTHRMLLTRPLLYTAITRATKLVLIVGDEWALRTAIASTDQTRTHCALAERLMAPATS